MTWIVHGTTRKRAERIEKIGPDPRFQEGSTGFCSAEQFCAYLANGPFILYTPHAYACRKAALFPMEGGAAIIEIDVPDDIIQISADANWMPVQYGLLQFDTGAGLEELRAGWSKFAKKIISVSCP